MNNKIFGKKNFDWTIMGGAAIIPRSLKTTRNEKFFIFKIIYDPLIFGNSRFSKIWSINMQRQGWLYVSILGQNVKIYSP